MSFQQRFEISVTTAADGSATAYLPVGAVSGRIVEVGYDKDGTTPYTDGVDFTITTERKGKQVWTEANVNASKSVQPSEAIEDDTGTAQTTRDFIRLYLDRIKIVLANGGNAKVGAFYAVIET
jgi:hypothetical protein